MSKEIAGTIHDESAMVKGVGRKDKVKVSIDNRGVYVSIKGHSTANGSDEIIMLENFGGKLRLHVWADITQEDPTHTIDLERANEIHRPDDFS